MENQKLKELILDQSDQLQADRTIIQNLQLELQQCQDELSVRDRRSVIHTPKPLSMRDSGISLMSDRQNVSSSKLSMAVSNALEKCDKNNNGFGWY